MQPPRSHMHRPGPTRSIGQEARQEFRNIKREKLSCEGIIEPVVVGSLRSLRPLREGFRASGHGAASWYGSSSQPAAADRVPLRQGTGAAAAPEPRHRPVRRGTPNKEVGFYEEEFPTWKVPVTDCGYKKPAPLPSIKEGEGTSGSYLGSRDREARPPVRRYLDVI